VRFLALEEGVKSTSITAFGFKVALGSMRAFGAHAVVRALTSAQVADNLLGASAACSTSSLKVSRLATVGPVLLESSIVLLKDSGDVVPPRSTQWSIVSNRDIGAISLASRVLEVPVGGCA